MSDRGPANSVSLHPPIQVQRPCYRTEEILAELATCFNSGWTGYGADCQQFETNWCSACSLPNALFLSSATAGLQLALRVLKAANNWDASTEIITTPLTFVATNHAILLEGLTPVFADVDDTLTLNPESVRDRLSSRTRGVMFVGLGGNPGRIEEISSLCRERGLALILDAAHMAGSAANGRHVGYQADASVFSFHAVKNLPIGHGGMLCFQESRLHAMARRMAWLGISKTTFDRVAADRSYSWAYDVDCVGYNFLGSSILARIGLVQLRHLQDDNAKRRALAVEYDQILSGLPALSLIPTAPGHVHSRHLYQLRSPQRSDIAEHLRAHGIQTGVHYRTNQAYHMYRACPGTCPIADAASDQLLTLPLHLGLEASDVTRIAMLIREFLISEH